MTTTHTPIQSAPAAATGSAPLLHEELLVEAQHLRHRAESLRTQAASLDHFLATSYRRRASELELEAWLLEVRSGLPLDEIRAAA